MKSDHPVRFADPASPLPATIARHWQIRTLLLGLVIACLLPGIIGAAILLAHEFVVGRGNLEKNTVSTARALVLAVDGQLLKAKVLAQTLSSTGSLPRHDLAQFHQRARQLLATTGVGSNVVLSDESGQQLVNTLREFGQPLPRHGNPELLRRVFGTGQPVISDVYVGGVTGRPVMSVDVPVTIGARIEYDLSVGLLPDYFKGILDAESMPPDWVAAIFDSTGTIVARTHAPERFVGQKGTEEFIRRISQEQEGWMESTTREGIQVLSVWSRSPVTGWSVGIGIPRQAVEGNLIRTLSALTLGVLVLLLGGLTLAWLTGMKIARSVRALTAPAMALGAAEPAPVPHVEIREAAEVAWAIDRAAGLLGERTEALREANRSLLAREAELAEAHRLAKFGTWNWNLKTDAVTVSDSVREIYGRDVPPFAEQRGTMLTVESWERVQMAAQEAMRSGAGFDLEVQVIHGGGARIWVNAKCEAIRDANGEVVALRGTVQDVTERKRAESELRKLSLAVDQSPASVLITDTAGRIEYVNPAFCVISGYAAEEVHGQNPRILASGRTPREHYAELWHALAKGQTWRGLFINRRKDGSEYIEQAIISPVRQADGRVSHYLAVQEDITERLQTESRLQASEERLRLAQTAAAIAIYDYDMVRGEIQWDERMRQLWGVAPEAPVSYEMLVTGVHPDDRPVREAAFAAALDPAGDGRYQAEYRVIGLGDGVRRDVASTGQAFFENGRPVRFIGTVRDVTARKALEKALQERRSEMELLLQHQVAAQTAAAIAHDLNQPLVAISAYSEVALGLLQAGTATPEKLARPLENCVEQAHRAGRTLHELLAFLHKGEAEVAAFDLNELIRESVAVAQDNGRGGFHPILELAPKLVAVLGNRLQVQKVVLNLVRNGVEAMREAGVPMAAITIAVRSMPSGRMAQVTVRDSGPGLDAETAQRVFEPFFTTKRSGLGLGLAISRALIEAHGGQLWLDPDAGPGATFHFTLPFAHD